jgi:hypothetical protein
MARFIAQKGVTNVFINLESWDNSDEFKTRGTEDGEKIEENSNNLRILWRWLQFVFTR